MSSEFGRPNLFAIEANTRISRLTFTHVNVQKQSHHHHYVTGQVGTAADPRSSTGLGSAIPLTNGLERAPLAAGALFTSSARDSSRPGRHVLLQ